MLKEKNLFFSNGLLFVLVLLMLTELGTCHQFGIAGSHQPSTIHKKLAYRGGATGGASQTVTAKKPDVTTCNPFLQKVYKLTDNMFDEFDSNSDGVLSFDEVYEIMLRVSIQVNRQAPIPPPTRATAKLLFDMSDVDNSGKLSKDELKKIMSLAMPRTTARLVGHKLVTLVLAPYLAVKTVNALSGKVWLKDLGEKLVPERFQSFVLTKDFWKLTLAVGFVSVLGNLVLQGVTWLYDYIFHVEAKKED
jgi:hypothetical protein